MVARAAEGTLRGTFRGGDSHDMPIRDLRTRAWRGAFLAAAALALLSVSPAYAQTNTGEIGGVVKDSSGGVLPGATVTARHPASGTVVERVTDGEGRYYLPALRIGQWDVTTTLSGFGPQTQKVTLEIGRTLSLDFQL